MILEGLTVPLVTPPNEDDSLDEASLQRMIDRVIGGGARAIFVLGTAGEFATLNRTVKDRLVRVSKEIIRIRCASMSNSLVCGWLDESRGLIWAQTPMVFRRL